MREVSARAEGLRGGGKEWLVEWRREAEDAVGMVLKKDEGRVETSFATCRGKHLGGERDAACKLRPQRLQNPSMNNKVHN